MKTTLIIFKKELIDTLRDRRTIFLMIVMPFLVIYLMLNVVTSISMSQVKKAREKVLKIGLITNGNAADFRSQLLQHKDFTIEETIPQKESFTDLIRQDKYDFILVFENDFDQKIKDQKSGQVKIYYKASSEIRIAKERVIKAVNDYSQELLSARLQNLNLDHSFVQTIDVNEQDVATVREMIGEYVGGYLPYFIILFCFIGAMYPAIDLAAGEKERGTIETLLASPASRMQIVMGKFLVVTLAGIMTALISILWLFITINRMKQLPPKILTGLLKIIELKSIVMLMTMIIPLCIFFAAMLLSLSAYAKTFKEAQSIITPLNFLVIIPLVIGTLPGIKLNALTAMIPLLNISLASKEIIAGTIKVEHLLIVYFVLIAMAALSLYFCAQWFKREDVIFRN